MTLLPLAIVESWVARGGRSPEVLRWFCGPRGTVVVEQLAELDRTVSSAFTVRHGEVIRVERFDVLADALAAAALTDDDEVIHRS